MSKGRVIRTLRDRLEIEEKLQALAQERDDAVREEVAQALAQRGEQVVPVILRHLKTTDPLLRAALGLVASHLPRDVIVSPLYGVVSDPRRSDQERMAALMILERFLGEDIEDSMYVELRDPDAVMEQALREVVENVHRLPEIIIDFVAQLEEEPAEVALSMLAIAERFPEDEIFPVLVALAFDLRPEVAEVALHHLGRSHHPEAGPTLETLAEFLPSPQKSLAERGVRKLRLRGGLRYTYEPTPWRAFVSAPDIHGTQAFWLLRDGDAPNILLSLLANVDLGLQFAFVLSDIPREFIPPPSSPPNKASIPLDISVNQGERRIAWLREVPLAHARRWLKSLTARNYANEYALPTMYRLHVARFWQETREAGIADPPDLPEGSRYSLPDPHRFFNHEAFVLWNVMPTRDVLRRLRRSTSPPTVGDFYVALRLVRDQDFPADLWDRVADRLMQTAEWFIVVGESEMAAQAASVAWAMRSTPYSINPFAHVLVERGLFEAFQRLRRESEQDGEDPESGV